MMDSHRLFLYLGFLLHLSFSWAATAVAANEDATPAPIRYNRDVRPILSDQCFRCHGPERHRKAGLRLDLPREAVAERDGRPPVPGSQKRARSSRITSDDELDGCPRPTRAWSSRREVDVLRRWVAQGAEYQPHWAFMPPQVAPAAPSRTRRLAAQPDRRLRPGAAGAGRARARRPRPSRETLLRRVTLDLTGLPPTPGEVDAFLADRRPTPTRRPSTGCSPRRATASGWRCDWLDAARYADTNGY